MKNSKNMLLMAATMVVTAQAEETAGDNLSILRTTAMNGNISVEMTSDNSDTRNFFQNLACNCDSSEHETSITLRIKHNALAQNFAVAQAIGIPKNILLALCWKQATNEGMQYLENDFLNKAEKMLSSVDENGKTPMDIVGEKLVSFDEKSLEEQIKLAGCVGMQRGFDELQVMLQERDEKKKNEKLEKALEGEIANNNQ